MSEGKMITEIAGHIFVARVTWSQIGGSGRMGDMYDEYMAKDVAYCPTYEEAMEAALPFCAEKTKWMHEHGGYNQEAHATIDVRMEYVLKKAKTFKELMDETAVRKAEEWSKEGTEDGE